MNTTMAVTFLVGLYETDLPGEVPVAKTLFHDVISDLADSFSLSSLSISLVESNMRAGMPGYRLASRVAPSPIIDLRNSHNFAAFLCLCQRLELRTELHLIAKKMIMEAKTTSLELFHGIYLPFLKTLMKVVREQNIGINDSPFQKLFQQILSRYIERYVQAEPTPPKGWKRPTFGCGCEDCQHLSRFLLSPGETVHRLTTIQKRRKHLEDILRSSKDCTCETDKRGSPQTLVVTKNQAQHLAIEKAWTQRRDMAKKYLGDLGADELRPYLGKNHGQIMPLAARQPMQTTRATQRPG